MFFLSPPDHSRSYIHLAEALRRKIQELGIAEGERIPSERELAQMLKVSRPSLREALIVLELQGEIEIRVGSGIYRRQTAENISPTNHPPSEPVSRGNSPALGQSPHDVSQMRYLLEGSIAAYAARFITKIQLRKLQESLNEMRQAIQDNSCPKDHARAKADRKFHVYLAQVTKNPLVISTIESLFDQRFSLVSNSLHQKFENLDVWSKALDEHQEIFDAIADNDPLQAQAAMQRHLTSSYERLMALIEE